MAGEPAPVVPEASAAPAAAAAPQAPEPASPPAAVPADAAAAPAPEVAAPAAAAGPEPTLLQKFDAEGKAPAEAKPEGDAPKDAPKPDGEKPAGDKPAEPKPGDAKPAEAKPAEAKPGEKPAETKAPEPAKLDPVAYEYALPETIKMDDALKGEFHTALDAFRADPAKGAQPLIDLHNKAMTDYAAQVDQNQRDVWNETRKGWTNDVLADEQIGGSGHRTAMGAIARMRDMFVPAADRPAFEQFLQITGAGDHPQFLRMMHNAARLFDEPKLPPADIKPSPNNGANPNARRGGLLYDHPRSNPNRT